jgi:choline dehydrogenase-like flavoprotein
MIDTLIIGGGTAGCVLAARLSADPDHRVRLVEAGPVSTDPAVLLDATRMPIGPESPWVWRYPVILAGAVTGNIVRGKVIGGSGAVNGGYFVRATAPDFAAWSKELDGWSYDAVLSSTRARPRFRRPAGTRCDGPDTGASCHCARSSELRIRFGLHRARPSADT